MHVRGIMSEKVQVARPDMTLQEVARIMSPNDVGALPVGENDMLVGMITDRDIAVRAVAEGMPSETKVADVMSTEIKYCFDDQDVDDVLRNMSDVQVRRLPVVDREKRLVGIISLGGAATSHDVQATGEALGGISQHAA
jgi:CBS domain-containing protein